MRLTIERSLGVVARPKSQANRAMLPLVLWIVCLPELPGLVEKETDEFATPTPTMVGWLFFVAMLG